MKNDFLTPSNIAPDTIKDMLKEGNILRGTQDQYNSSAVDLYQENCPLVSCTTFKEFYR